MDGDFSGTDLSGFGDFSSLFGSGDAGTASSGISSVDPSSMVNPYPASAGGQGPEPPTASIDPGLLSYLNMLGLSGTASVSGNGAISPAQQPMTTATTQMGLAPTSLTSGMAPAFLNLGISGQKALQGQDAPTTSSGAIPYTTNAMPATSTQGGSGAGGGGIMGGMGGLMGKSSSGATGQSVGQASESILGLFM